MRRVLPLVLSLLIACDPGTASEADCEALFPSECAQEPSCAAISGHVVLGDGPSACVDFTGGPADQGCDAANQDCLDVETLAAPSDDPADCWLFADSCIPAGWGPCEDIEGPLGEC